LPAAQALITVHDQVVKDKIAGRRKEGGNQLSPGEGDIQSTEEEQERAKILESRAWPYPDPLIHDYYALFGRCNTWRADPTRWDNGLQHPQCHFRRLLPGISPGLPKPSRSHLCPK